MTDRCFARLSRGLDPTHLSADSGTNGMWAAEMAGVRPSFAAREHCKTTDPSRRDISSARTRVACRSKQKSRRHPVTSSQRLMNLRLRCLTLTSLTNTRASGRGEVWQPRTRRSKSALELARPSQSRVLVFHMQGQRS